MIPKRAIVQVGAHNRIPKGAEIYLFPANITEAELQEEIHLLKEFYSNVEIQLPLPPHIRAQIVLNDVPFGY